MGQVPRTCDTLRRFAMKKREIQKYPPELSDEIGKIYQEAIAGLPLCKIEAIHDFMAKNPQTNIAKCLEGANHIHKSNKIRYLSRKQAMGNYFLLKRDTCPKLYRSDISNSLLVKLKYAEPGSFTELIRNRFSGEFQRALDSYDVSEKPSSALRKLLVQELNALLTTRSLYDERYFPDLPLRERTLLAMEPQEGDINMMILNRLLLQSVFSEIRKIKTPHTEVSLDMDELEVEVESSSPLESLVKQEEIEQLNKVVALTISQLKALEDQYWEDQNVERIKPKEAQTSSPHDKVTAPRCRGNGMYRKGRAYAAGRYLAYTATM